MAFATTPATIISNLKLFDGNGFLDWEYRIKIKLERENCLEALFEKPEGMTQNEFDKKDAKAKDIIVQWLSDQIIGTIRDKKTAKEIYESLKSTYIRSGLSARLNIKKDLNEMKFTKGKLKEFIDSFSCKIQEYKAAGGELKDDEIISILLMAMPRNYQSVTTSIDIYFSQNPNDVTIEFVKNKLFQEEARQEREKPFGKKNSDDVVFYSSNNSNFKYKCNYCKKRGHMKTECYKLKNRQKNSKNCSEKDNCNLCNHETSNENKEEIAFTINEVNNSNQEKSFKNNIVFIIDSGCTQHLINQDYEEFLCDVENVHIELNIAKKENKIIAIKRGSLHMEFNGHKIKLMNVLLCKDIFFNLLSVSRAENEGFQVLFKDGHVYFNKNGKTLLNGIKKGNLYTVEFNFNQEYSNLSVSENNDLMHRRMGHSSIYKPSSICEICLKGKMTRSTFKSIDENLKPKRILEVVSSDVSGPITPETFDGYKYYVTFIDHFSHFTYVYLLKKKSEVLEKFKEYEAMVYNRFQVGISRFRCDKGGEYTSDSFKEFCKKKGIVIEYNIPRNPEQNGVCERLNRTILNMSRCLIMESNLEKDLWGEAVRISAYIINRLPTKATNKIPAEIWYNREISLNNMKVFGSRAYSHIPKEDRNGKLAERCKSLIMIGYTSNGYRLWDPNLRKIITAKSVKFDEKLKEKDEIPMFTECQDSISDNEEEQKRNDSSNIEEGEQRKSTRNRKLPSKYDDFELNMMVALMAGNLPSETPSTYEEAIKSGEDWESAINEELSNHEKNETWKLEPQVNCDSKLIDSKWVFTKKIINDKPVKKARLVARGFMQDNNEDEDLYAPVARMATLRVLLSLALEQDMSIHQMDVKSAFLNGTLKEPVYMKPPQGLQNVPENYICKLVKSLYGLKCAPKDWNNCLNTYLIKIGFNRCEVDPCLYFKDNTYLLVWVDDIILMSISEENIIEVKNLLKSKFEMKDINVKNKFKFLGLEIERQDKYIYISQKELIDKILKRFNMFDCKESYIPLPFSLKINLDDKNQDELNLPYRELIGSLMYLMLGSRPDLCFSITYFSQYQHNYTPTHWKYLKNVLKYLKGSKEFKLKFEKSQNEINSLILDAYVDADFGSDINDRKSISGFVIKLNNNVICWKSKKQSVVALSSAESEYISLALCLTECIYIKQLIENVTNIVINQISVYEDNQSAIKIANTRETKRSKHIDVKHHFIRDLIEKNIIKLIYIPTDKQIADIMTKALARQKFEQFRSCLGLEK